MTSRNIQNPLAKSTTASTVMGVFLLAGCSFLPVSQGSLYAAPDAVPAVKAVSPEQSQLMYELMIAELAGRRGYVDIATEGYFNAAQRTDDPRVSERATKLAVYGRRWQQAEEAGKRWAELVPDNPEVHQLLAQVYMRQGNSAAATEELDKLISTMTDDASGRMDEIFSFLAREPNRKVALETMTGLRDKYAEDSYANLALAQLAFASSSRDIALEAVDRAITLDKDNNNARLLRVQILASSGNTEQGFDELREALEADPDNIALHQGYARLLVEAGRYDEASTEFEVIYGLGADNPAALFSIGLLALESRRNGAAEKYLTQLLSLGSYKNEANYYLGRIADSRQDYTKAIDHYLKVSPSESYVDAQIRVAELYGATDRVELGRSLLEKLVAENSDPAIRPRVIQAEGRILAQSGQTDEALKVLTGGLELYPDNTSMLYSRALAADSNGDKELFETDLRTLIRIEPENAHALNALGYYFADANINLDEAEKLLVKANELLPQDPAIIDSLGWLRYRQGDNEEALQLLRQAYQLLSDGEIAAHLGEVLWMSGERESAKELWEKALLDTPGDTALKDVMERFVQ